jgi:hypothetical protein
LTLIFAFLSLFLQAGMQLAPAAAAAGSASSAKQQLTASLSSPALLDITIASSCIAAAQQLQALAAAAAAWQADPLLLQQLLRCLAAPGGSCSLTSSGQCCWLINQTGAPLSYVVADAATAPTAVAAVNSAASPVGGSGVRVSLPVGSMKGSAGHNTPVALQVLDTAAAGYYGRYVDSPNSSSSSSSGGATSRLSDGRNAAAAAAAVSSGAVKKSQLLYLQAAGQLNVAGPIALEQLGCSIHSMRVPGGLGGAAAAAAASGGVAGLISLGSIGLPRYAAAIV